MLKKVTEIIKSYPYQILFGLATIIYVIGLFIPIYGVDVSIYSSISREIIDTGNWLEITTKGKDYLDKPPFLFWTSALSYLVFGFNSFAYKFPSFIFTIIGIYSTYILGRELYSKQVGIISSLVLYTCFAWFLFNADVRTDTIVSATIILSVSQIILYLKSNSWKNLILAFIGIGIAMLTKGPIGLMVPVLGLGTHFIFKGQWSNIFKWQWLIGIVIAFTMLIPMLYGLYNQFDAHPEKITVLSSGMKQKGISGLKFYFWDQSFGRITGGNKEWKDDSSPFFFTHTFLWAFFPWAIIAILGLLSRLKKFFTDKREYITIGAIILPFIAFSMSQFKLPHYINVIFPFVSIITAQYLVHVKIKNWIKFIHYFISGAVTIATIILMTYIFPNYNIFIWIGWTLLISLIWIFSFKIDSNAKFIFHLASVSLLLNFVFNSHFLQQMKAYNAPYNASYIINSIQPDEIHTNLIAGYTLDIFSFPVNSNSNPFESINKGKKTVFFCNKDYLKVYEERYSDIIKNVYEIKYYPITRMTIGFINPKTRDKKTRKLYLIEFK